MRLVGAITLVYVFTAALVLSGAGQQRAEPLEEAKRNDCSREPLGKQDR